MENCEFGSVNAVNNVINYVNKMDDDVRGCFWTGFAVGTAGLSLFVASLPGAAISGPLATIIGVLPSFTDTTSIPKCFA
jgi:hypothetical protein